MASSAQHWQEAPRPPLRPDTACPSQAACRPCRDRRRQVPAARRGNPESVQTSQDGVVEEILVNDGESVEFDQELIRIK